MQCLEHVFMVTTQYNMTRKIHALTPIHYLRGKRTIADQITQHCKSVCALVFGMRNASIKSMQIAVDVGEQCKLHSTLRCL